MHVVDVSEPNKEADSSPDGERVRRGDLDLVTFGQRLRHFRVERGLTLAELAGRVGRAQSLLSLLENGRREPKLSLLRALAAALEVTTEDLLSPSAPSRRAQLEIEIAEAHRRPALAGLRLPELKIGKRVPTDILEHISALYGELQRREAMRIATPEEAREANGALRRMMRDRGNYFPAIERVAEQALAKVEYTGGALPAAQVYSIVSRYGFELRYASDLPRSVRSITDLRNHRVYLRRESLGMHSPRTILLQTLGHFVLGHSQPKDYADFLRQRIEANYFAAAVLVPERIAVPFLTEAKREQDIAVEDIRDVFGVSYEMACHRFTNLMTEHLDIVCHFVRNDESGIIYKAYENDGLVFPSDPTGAIEGQRMCRYWSGRQVFKASDRHSIYYQYTDKPSGTHFCIAHVDPTDRRDFAITLGVSYVESRWFRGRDTRERRESRCPDPTCCQEPPAELAARWQGMTWPSVRAHSHVLAALPPGSFPGVDETEVYTFLDKHAIDPADVR